MQRLDTASLSDFIPMNSSGRDGGRVRRGGGGGGNYGGRGGRNHGGRGGDRGGGRGRGGRGRGGGNRGGGRGRGRGRGGGNRGGGRGPPDYSRDWQNPIEQIGDHASTADTLGIAIQGCSHGEIDAIYERLQKHKELSPDDKPIDLLICCGDFQSLRNTADYHSLAVPPKYRTIGSFWKYYAGIKKAPVLTIFIGGNHEASQPLHELYYGGWVAPNIYYLGAAGVVNVGGIRIGGLSGIYKSHDYVQGRFEQPPYDRSSIRSIYHVRNVDVYRMKCLSSSLETNPIDVMLSHDWPQGIEQHGNTNALIRQKPFFREEIQRNDLGSPANWEVLQTLHPKWWFSAHLHVKFTAQVQHTANTIMKEPSVPVTSLVPSQVGQPSPEAKSKQTDTDKNKPDTVKDTTQFRSIESDKASCAVDDLTDQMTRFLSLDKCLPRRHHLSVLHVPIDAKSRNQPLRLAYDVEWLATLKKTHHLTCPARRRVSVPFETMPPTPEEMEWIRNRFGADLDIPENFVCTVPPYHPQEQMQYPLPQMGNPQTDCLLQKLELEHVITIPFRNNNVVAVADENEIDLDDIEDNDEIVVPKDENEIDLDDSDGENEVKDDNEIDLDSVEGETEGQVDESAAKKARLAGSE